MPPASEAITLTVAGHAFSGWTAVRIVRGIETCTNSFDLLVTERLEAETTSTVPGAVVALFNEGDACTVSAGGDLLITGYIDRIITSIGPAEHNVRIVGRGKCCDLIDCTSELPTSVVANANILQLAKQLAAPYGLTVNSVGDPGPVLPQFNVSLTDTPWAIIEEAARFRGLLAYEDPGGNLVLGPVGTKHAASGMVLGENILAATFTRAMDGRYSEVVAYLTAMNLLGSIGAGGNMLDRETDPNVPRHRRKAIIAEATYGGQDVAKKRALWEIARRAGRGREVEVMVDSWRDAAGVLWTPNTLANIAIPALELQSVTWCLSSVSYVLDGQNGTRAEIVAMDPTGLTPEPILLAPVIRGLR